MKKIFYAILALIGLVSLCTYVITNSKSDETKYTEAMQLMKENKTEKALSLLKELGNKDYMQAIKALYGYYYDNRPYDKIVEEAENQTAALDVAKAGCNSSIIENEDTIKYIGENTEHERAMFEQLDLWLDKAIEFNDDNAMFLKGQRFYYAEDYLSAIKWFEKSAELNNTDAMLSLGNACVSMIDVNMIESADNTKWAQKGVYWFTKADSLNVESAGWYLSHFYTAGIGVDKDFETALYYLNHSATLGYFEAQVEMAQAAYYLMKDTALARKWITEAMKNNSKSDITSMWSEFPSIKELQ